jgi:2-polyprenyl-6-methoxyphenol hydroxylase-like FAD-dependent oxidoreductase
MMTMDRTRDHAIVLGASMAGLLAARVLSEFYHSVTLVDRDGTCSTSGLALVIGDPEATALAIIGERAAIVHLLARAKQALSAYPTKRIAITDIDGNVSVRDEVTGELWTPETAAQQLRFAAEDGCVLRIQVREG